MFKKQVDNLKTNYRGVYVLQDNRFRWLSRVPQSPPPAPEAIARQLYFPCGLLRGALAALSVTCTVSAEVVQLPQCAPQPCPPPGGCGGSWEGRAPGEIAERKRHPPATASPSAQALSL